MKVFLILFLLLTKGVTVGEEVVLPKPSLKGNVSLEEAIKNRRSIRNFSSKSLSLEQISQILWSAQGITNNKGYRSVPSAGATYPLEVFALIVNEGIEQGLYKYQPEAHSLKLVLSGDLRQSLAKSALNQNFIIQVPLNLIITADFKKTTSHYGERGIMYVHMEVGHLGQNVYLQSVALGLGTVAVGAFRTEEVKKVLKLPSPLEPLYILPVGYPK